jgi:hypothetical protein
MEKRYLSERELAEKLGLCRQTLRVHRMRGTGLPYSRLEGRVIYDLGDVEDYIESHKVRPRSEQ